MAAAIKRVVSRPPPQTRIANRMIDIRHLPAIEKAPSSSRTRGPVVPPGFAPGFSRAPQCSVNGLPDRPVLWVRHPFSTGNSGVDFHCERCWLATTANSLEASTAYLSPSQLFYAGIIANPGRAVNRVGTIATMPFDGRGAPAREHYTAAGRAGLLRRQTRLLLRRRLSAIPAPSAPGFCGPCGKISGVWSM